MGTTTRKKNTTAMNDDNSQMTRTSGRRPQASEGTDPKCALHNWGARQRKQAQVLQCETCGIHLCVECYQKFDTIEQVHDFNFWNFFTTTTE